MRKLATYDRPKLLDLLGERLAFERRSVRLYDTTIGKLESSNDPRGLAIVDELRVLRDEEKEHEGWLEETIVALGGDPGAATDRGQLVERESEGLEQVIEDDDELSHLLHALLAAELADSVGWDLLVTLAAEAHDREAKRELRKRLYQEEEHLAFIYRTVRTLALRAVLGHDVAMPSS